MAKKFVITGITCTTQAEYSVNRELQNGSIVKSITFNRPDVPFNKGFQMSGASYTIRLDNEAGSVENIRILVPFHIVANMVGEWVENKKADDPEAVGLVE